MAPPLRSRRELAPAYESVLRAHRPRIGDRSTFDTNHDSDFDHEAELFQYVPVTFIGFDRSRLYQVKHDFLTVTIVILSDGLLPDGVSHMTDLPIKRRTFGKIAAVALAAGLAGCNDEEAPGEPGEPGEPNGDP